MIISFSIDPLAEPKKAFFEVLGRNGQYSVIIPIIKGIAVFEPSACSCLAGSYWNQTKENRKNGKRCKHLSECLNFLEREGWIEEIKK